MHVKTEAIAVVDENGTRLIVEKETVMAPSQGKPGRPRKMELFRLLGGEMVNWVGPTEFVATSTGHRLRRT